MTFIATLRRDQISAPFVFDQPVDVAGLAAWAERQL